MLSRLWTLDLGLWTMPLHCDHPRDIAGFEARVDIDDRDVGGAAIEHTEESRDAAQAGTVADAGGDGDYGASNVPSHDASQCGLHTGDNDHRICADDPVEL